MKWTPVCVAWFAAALAGAAGSGAHAAENASRSAAPPGAVPAQLLAVEAESLASTAVSAGGAASAQGMGGFGTGWSGNSQLFWSPASPGAVLDLTVDVPAGAEYAVELYFAKAPDYGQVSIEIAGQASAVTMDGYAPRVMPPVPVQAGRFPLAAGPGVFSFKVVGKSPSSGGYRMGLDQLRLYPVGPLPEGAARPRSEAVTARPVSQVPAAAPAGAKSGTAPGGGAPSSPPATPKKPGARCDSTCVGNVATVYRQAEDGSCPVWFRFPCSPYGCDEAAGLCKGVCSSNADCAQGALCDTLTGLCASASSACADAYTVRMPNGQIQSCMPYKCVGGACQNVCSLPGECGPGYACNVGTGLCVQAPPKK